MTDDGPRPPEDNERGDEDSISSSLLESVRRDDPEAWRRLVRLFGPLVYEWCRRAGLQPADASDIGQEVFRAVAGNVFRFRRERPSDTFRGWLWTITRNKIHDCWRQQRNQPEAFGGTTAQRRIAELPAEPEDSGGGDASRGALTHRALELLRAEFTERTWRAFWLLAVGRKTPAEVAAELGMSPNAVYLARSRVLRRLREEFGGLLD